MRPGRHALVLGDGHGPERADLDRAWPGWDAGIDLVLAADGGARLAERLGVRIDRWVGDGDSYPREDVDALAKAGIAVRILPTAKDESDLELAVLEAAHAGATRITILGALGGARLDHELANISLLAHPGLAAIDVRLVDGATRVSVIRAPDSAGAPVTAVFDGRARDLVSLLPLGDAVRGITTHGLEYPLTGEPLVLGAARGLSNVRTIERSSVTVRDGRLLVVETPANLDR